MMQAVEIAIFLIASIMIGSLFILFVTNLDPGKIFSDIKGMIFPEPFKDQNALLKVSLARFHDLVYNCWQKCEVGETFLNCGTVYITDGTALDSNSLLKTFRKYNFCLDCNVKVVGENGEEKPISLPAVVDVNCSQNQIVIKG